MTITQSFNIKITNNILLKKNLIPQIKIGMNYLMKKSCAIHLKTITYLLGKENITEKSYM